MSASEDRYFENLQISLLLVSRDRTGAGTLMFVNSKLRVKYNSTNTIVSRLLFLLSQCCFSSLLCLVLNTAVLCDLSKYNLCSIL